MQTCKFEVRLEAFKLLGQRISIPSVEIILPICDSHLEFRAFIYICIYRVNKKALGLRLIEQ